VCLVTSNKSPIASATTTSAPMTINRTAFNYPGYGAAARPWNTRNGCIQLRAAGEVLVQEASE
jgi:hypothetical protein